MTKLSFETIPWKHLTCAKSQLRLDIVLKCGQSFRWTEYPQNPQSWIGVLKNRVWLLTQDEEQIRFKTLSNTCKDEEEEKEKSILTDYFQLDVDIEQYYKVSSQLPCTILAIIFTKTEFTKNFRNGQRLIQYSRQSL